MFRPDEMTADESASCRRIAKEPGTLAVYARMALALTAGQGVRLTAAELFKVLVLDDAPRSALAEAIMRDNDR